MVVVIVCVVIISDAAVVAIITYRSCSLAEICCSCNFQNVHKLIVTPVKKKIVRIETEFIFVPRPDAPGVYVPASMPCCFCGLNSSETFRQSYGGR